MRMFLSFFSALSLFGSYPLIAAGTSQETLQKPTAKFDVFTGKVIKNRVRLRLQPTLESPVVRELKQGDLLIILDEEEDFYAVQPPADVKGYVFRTYVLDNVVEANRVNVRTAPETDAPVMVQLSVGDRVEGINCPINAKWLEIAPPTSVRFYIAKEYIQKVGGPAFLVTYEKRLEEVTQLLAATYVAGQSEMQKSFPEIDVNGIYKNYNKVINEYSDFPEQVAKAKEMMQSLQDSYLQKKVAYLESKQNANQNQNQPQLNIQEQKSSQKFSQMEQQLQRSQGTVRSTIDNRVLNNKMAAWAPNEQNLYQAWAQQNNYASIEEFYRAQREEAITLTGIIEPYIRVIKNKPGDYIIINPISNQPMAYLYSTHIDLQDKVGHVATLKVFPRANNNFAFPAYFVLSVE